MTPITSQTTTIMAPIFMLDSCREESSLGAVNPDGNVPLGTRSQGRRKGQARPLHDRPLSGPPHARGAVGWLGRVDRPPDPPADGRRRVLPVPSRDMGESVSRR